VRDRPGSQQMAELTAAEQSYKTSPQRPSSRLEAALKPDDADHPPRFPFTSTPGDRQFVHTSAMPFGAGPVPALPRRINAMAASPAPGTVRSAKSTTVCRTLLHVPVTAGQLQRSPNGPVRSSGLRDIFVQLPRPTLGTSLPTTTDNEATNPHSRLIEKPPRSCPGQPVNCAEL